jgi:hypothetical protein
LQHAHSLLPAFLAGYWWMNLGRIEYERWLTGSALAQRWRWLSQQGSCTAEKSTAGLYVDAYRSGWIMAPPIRICTITCERADIVCCEDSLICHFVDGLTLWCWG